MKNATRQHNHPFTKRGCNKKCMISALVLVQSTIDTHTALPCVTHITGSFQQMPSVTGREGSFEGNIQRMFSFYTISDLMVCC